MVAGHSGMGKSTLMNRILAYLGGQVWQHTSFRGVPFPETQIVWLRRNVPEHCTVGTLCSTFGDYTDSVLGLKLYSGIFSKLQGSGRNTYLAEIRRIVTSHHVGVLVLDEFQNLSLMGVGAKKIIALLVNLRDELGLPIVVVGTYKALRLLKSELSSARRLVEGGYFDLERPLSAADEHWQSLCAAAWEFQWVRKPVEYSDGISAALYEVSQGITGIMLTTFATAQVAAIEDGSECVTEDLIRAVFAERMKPLHPAVRVLQSGDPILMDQFDDMYKNFWPSTERESVDGAAEDSASSPEVVTDDPAAAALAAAGKLKPRRPKRASAEASEAGPSKPLLSEEQIQRLVMTDSVKDLIALLDGR
ncbi:MAG: ATP-binding protein [Burkholderiaceae bacterium]